MTNEAKIKDFMMIFFILAMIIVWSVGITARSIIRNLQVVNVTENTVELNIMGEVHIYEYISP